ncbi:DUF732 domain-containing protein [Microbacterium sp. 77mftsu3.1]|uniref:DUF732 domain-containing protein n=1 Tax=Microbacterium sp. 77mftsu3.1 TaxID=1761802 RepID=UPI000475AF92|nr:DUF732 domain-containing protein [Microbacterium sp. 77mftsu3.1]SDH39435.1 hypothetical protein SAMN04488590_3224 [Microbacterium sp. 77mftsu3.1]
MRVLKIVGIAAVAILAALIALTIVGASMAPKPAPAPTASQVPLSAEEMADLAFQLAVGRKYPDVDITAAKTFAVKHCENVREHGYDPAVLILMMAADKAGISREQAAHVAGAGMGAFCPEALPGR